MVSLKEFEQNRESRGVVTDPGKITEIVDDLCLIENVMVDYTLGRCRGLTDEETESRAIKAVGRAMEALEKLTPTSVTKATDTSKSFSGHRAQGLSHVKRSDLFSCFPFP